MVRTYVDIKEVVVVVVAIEKVLRELGETPYEPMKEEQNEIIVGKPTMDIQWQIFNETLINFFGKGIDGKAKPSTNFFANNNHC